MALVKTFCFLWLSTAGTSAIFPKLKVAQDPAPVVTVSTPTKTYQKVNKPVHRDVDSLATEIKHTERIPRPEPDSTSAEDGASKKSVVHDAVADMMSDRLDKTLDTLNSRVEKSDDPRDKALMKMIAKVQNAQKERKKVKMMVVAYTIAQLALTAAKYVPLSNPIFFWTYWAIDWAKKAMIGPLDDTYASHQRAYASVVAELLEKYPEYKGNMKKLPHKVIIKTKNGKEIAVKILDEKKDLSEENLRLDNMGTMNLMTTALQMK